MCIRDRAGRDQWISLQSVVETTLLQKQQNEAGRPVPVEALKPESAEVVDKLSLIHI